MPETLVPETLVPERAGKERGMSDGDGPETGETAMSNAFARAGYTVPGVETPSDDGPEPRHYASPTAAVLDHAALYGATPDPGEPDNRPVWDETEAVAGIEQAVHTLIESVVPDGTQLADERESLLWGFVNMLHAQAGRIDRTADRIVLEMRDLERAQDGTEVKALELERLTERAHSLGDRRDAFETMRDFAGEAYRVETGQVWRPRQGSHTSKTGRLTSAAIDARDFRRARKDRETRAHLPEGTLVAIAGGREVADGAAIWTTLDRTKAKYEDMVLLHGGSPGVEKIAASWAEARGVDQVVCRPDWNAHGKAAPFRRNDELLNLLPRGVIAFPGSGITGNLVDKARQLGIPVYRVPERVPERTEAAPRVPIYAGVGARATPEPVLAHMREIAERLGERGWLLRTGGAAGADSAFAAAAPPDRREVIVPWRGYNGLDTRAGDTRAGDGSACRVLTRAEIEAMRPLAEPHHPAWERCAAKVRDLHARNVAVLLGTDLKQPVNAVVCWTQDGRDYGGTGLAIRLAQHHRIPVLNLAELDVRAAMDRLERIAQTLDRGNEKQQAVGGRSAEGDRHASADRVQKATRQRSMHL